VISFIISVYDRIDMLNACLATLEMQAESKEIIICHNGPGDPWIRMPHCGMVLKTGRAGANSCYESAEMAAKQVLGDWLCFPSDDSLYVKDFSRIMLETAEREKADLVYCDCIYRQDPDKGDWRYSVLETQPKMGAIDKTCFIVKRDLFDGFPPHPRDWRDGALIEQLIRDGARHAKAPGVLVVHQ
jgi:hypothetical protein